MNRNEILDSIDGLAHVGMSCVLFHHEANNLSEGEYDVLFRALECVSSYCNEMKKYEGKRLSHIPWNYIKIGVEEYNKEIEEDLIIAPPES